MNSTSVSSVIGNGLKGLAFIIQDYSLLAFHSVRHIFADTRYFADLVKQMDIIGVGSLKIVVIALAASQFSRFGETVLTGDAVSLALLRELGPVFTTLLVKQLTRPNTRA